MENYFKPPDPLVLDGNISENWKRFSQKFTLFSKATNLDSKDEDVQIACFLSLIGDDGLDLFNSFTFEAGKEKILAEIQKKFDDQCAPQRNVIFERAKFNTICQKEGQSFDSFLTELRKAVKTTGYKDQDEMIRDRIVIGLRETSSKERLMQVADLTLTKAINFCRATETSKDQVKILDNESKVDAVRATTTLGNQKKTCKMCGYWHKFPNRCSAIGKTCAKCQGRDHFAKVCSSTSGKRDPDPPTSKKYKKRVHNVLKEIEQKNTESDISSETSSEFEFYVSSVSGRKSEHQNSETMWTKEVLVNGQPVVFKLDTGAEVSTLPLSILKKVAPNSVIKKSNITLISYGDPNFKLKTLGEVQLDCVVKNCHQQVTFIVVKAADQIPLLGVQECSDLQLLKRLDSVTNQKLFRSIDDVISKYKHVFEGLGKFPTQHHITLKENAKPKINAIRRVPHILLKPLQNKLCDLVSKGIIEKVDKPSQWVHPLVIVEKTNGDLRLCLDPRDLNQAIQREHFLIPSCDDIAVNLSKKNFFTVLDMKDGYWQIELDNDSSDLMTFGTPFGRYKFKRLAFGLCSAPEVFQKKNIEVFGDLPGVGLYFDDLIVTGSTEAEHDQNLKGVLERASQYNIKFNKSKIQFKKESVKFMGQIFSKKGIETNKKYIEAILKMPLPQCKADVLRFLGMVKYVGKFIPNLSKLTAPLRNLTRNDVTFEWKDEHKNSFNNLLYLLTSAPVLCYFNSQYPIEIETDASKDGLGACLLQQGRPIAFASRSLTKTEQAYAQIEKETLAILFAVKKFHYFIYGMPTKIHSDHKPLEAIFKKDLQSASPRILRMRLKLLKYDLNIQYRPGKYMYISDALSRAFLRQTSPRTDNDIEFAVHSVIRTLPMSKDRIQQFANETMKDRQLSQVLYFINNSWPDQKCKIPDNIRVYHKLKEKLFVFENLLFLENKLVVPRKLRLEMIKLLHEGHLGMEKTKSQARKVFYWPGITTDIETYIKSCKICEKFARKNPKQNILSYPIPERPWERVGSDIFTYANQSYCVLFDAYSNWLEVLPIKNKCAESVICELKTVFARFGSPDILLTDNVPYNSEKFLEFAKDWNFTLVTRSPEYPRSNGLAEKAVSIAKNLLKKSLEEGKGELSCALLNYRNSSLKGMGYSPSQLLNSRNCKTKVPITCDLLQPKLCESVTQKMLKKRELNENYFNRTAKTLKPLNEGSDVTVLNHKRKIWEPAKIERMHENPRSYVLQDYKGNTIRRNRVDIRPSQNAFKVTDTSFEPESCSGTESSDSDVRVVPKPEICKHSPSFVPSETNTKLTTRSGRTIKQPERLNL
uniref:RNA-directed DNA polymerase n=1 Tax=Photinus pyralis TaxID=7054 RepID=A0A1Y1KVT8_PHOPY